MYNEYFVNHATGELRRTYNPKDNPDGIEWEKISVREYDLYKLVIYWYLKHTP
jgi:hypothetical protein